MLSKLIHRTLKKIFSAAFIGSAGFFSAAVFAAAAIAFWTIWASVIELKSNTVGGGHILPLTIKLLLCYSALVFFACSVVTLDLFQSRHLMARLFGDRWKLTTAMVGSALVCSVMYFLVTFAASHLELGEPLAERPSYRHASLFSFELIIPQPKFAREDGLTALFFFMSSCVSFGMFLFLSLRDVHHLESTLPGELWGAFSVGFLWLAVDEFFDVNRFITANVANLGLLTFRERLSYVVLVGYAIIALTTLLAYVPELWRNRLGFISLSTGVLFQGAALSIDFLYHAWRKEEAFEIAVSVMFFIAVIYYAYDEFDSYIQHQKILK